MTPIKDLSAVALVKFRLFHCKMGVCVCVLVI